MSINDVPDTHETWLANFSKYSGTDAVVDDSIPFEKVMAANLARFKTFMDEDRLRFTELLRAAQVIVREEEQKSYPLTKEQLLALDQLTDFLKSDSPYFVLKGFAGTGKTHLVSILANRLDPHSTLFTAPTNKATKVLKSLMPKNVCKTIYSALSLQMVAREDELVLTLADKKFNLGPYRIVFVDEASMLNTEVLDYIHTSARMYSLKFIFIGDPAQLPPVGEDLSPVFALRCMQAELTEVVRHDNQILTLATHIRRAIITGTRLKPIDLSNFEGPRSVWHLSPQGFQKKVRTAASQGFMDMRAIAWRNRTVDNLNETIRSELYVDDPSFWVAGDRIVVTEPIGEGAQCVATVDDEGIVSDVGVGEDTVTGLLCYFLNVKMEDGQTLRMRIIHERSTHQLGALLGKMASEARKPGKGKLWGEFWGMKKRFNSIRHSYAITSHRSQGSTFPTVFVDARDILANSDKDTAYRCLYVAVSRPASRLYVTGLPT